MGGGVCSVVVVDDAPEVRGLVRAQLRVSGRFEVVGEGGTGLEAIELCSRHQPDIALMDVLMPELDGLAALPRIREVAPRTRVVMYTGSGAVGLGDRARELGAAALIEKSTALGRLPDTLAAIMRDDADVVERRSTDNVGLEEHLEHLLIEAVHDYAIFMLDPQGRVMSWNPGAQRIKGYTADEIIGQHFRIFYPPDRQAERHPEHELDVARGGGRYEEEGWRIRKDGSRFWASVLISAVRDVDGRHVGFAKVTRDIDERRRMLLDAEDAATALAMANDELALANARLAREAADQAQFLAVTAHELRTPIGVLTGSAKLLVDHLGELTDGERLELVESVTASSTRLQRLLRDLLTAARLEAKAVHLELADLDLSELLGRAVLTTRAAHLDAAIEVDVPDGVKLRGDGDRLAQAVDNLLTNAVRYGAPPVLVRARVHGGQVEVAISDAGPGVPSELRDRLFERFASGSPNSGTGLGLFIVRELVRAHGGDAWYQVDEDGRPTFVLSIPSGTATSHAVHGDIP